MNANHNAVLADPYDVSCPTLDGENASSVHSNTDPAAHQEFVDLLQALREVSVIMQSDALSSVSKHNIRRAVISISTMLADARTLIAGEPVANAGEVPRGCVSSMEYELIAMDYRDTDSPAATLFNELDNVHQRAELLNDQLMENFNHQPPRTA